MLRKRIWVDVVLALGSSVALAVALKKEWHWFLCTVSGLAIGSAIIGLLADINALSDRKKIIAEIEGGDETKA